MRIYKDTGLVLFPQSFLTHIVTTVTTKNLQPSVGELAWKMREKGRSGFFYARSFSFCSLGEVQCKNVLARVVVTPLWSGRVLSNFPKPFLSYNYRSF